MNKKIKKIEELNDYHRRLLLKCMNMFEWKNLPEEIPVWYLNFWLFTYGRVAMIKKDGKYHICCGNYSGNLNEYGLGNRFVGANVGVQYDVPLYWEYDKMENVNNDEFAIMCFNDDTRCGLLDLVDRYSNLLQTADITLERLLVLSRVMPIINCFDENGKNQIKSIVNDIYDGKIVSIADLSSVFMDDTKNNVIDITKDLKYSLSETVETRADIYSRFCVEIGIPLVNNTKREQIISGEIGGVKTLSLVNIKNMLENRKRFCKLLNKIDNLNVDVKISDEFKIEIEESEGK